MAQREYVIRIVNDAGNGKRKTVAGDDDNTGRTAQSTQGGGTRNAAITGLVAWRTVKPWINQMATHQLNVASIRDGSTELAQRRQFGYQIATQTIGVVESMAAGFAVGNVTGAAIGLAVGLGHTLMSYANNQQIINERRNLENRSLQMNYIRAGARGSRASYE